MDGVHIGRSPDSERECGEPYPLLDLLTGLSPPGSTVRFGSRSEPAPPGAINVLEMVSVRCRSTLLPARSLPAAGIVLARARLTDLSLRERVLRLAAAAALASGGALVVNRRRVFVDAPGDRVPNSHAKTIDDLLSDILDRRVWCGLALNRNYRANQKALLTVVDSSGRVVAYCKVASNPLTRDLIAHEADVLRALGTHNFKHLTLPSLVWIGDVGSLSLLLVSALKAPLFIARSHPERVLRAMTELALSTPWPRTTLAASAWWTGLRTTIDALPTGDVRASLSKSSQLLEDTYGGETVAFGRWHGDWTRWNTAITFAGVLVWDLERSEDLAPIGFDAMHWRLGALIEAVPPQDISTILLAIAECAVEPCSIENTQPAPSAAIVWGWLLTIALRVVEDARLSPSPSTEQRVAHLERLVSASSESLVRYTQPCR